MNHLFFFCLFTAAPITTFAENQFDSHSREGVHKTQDFLRSREQRETYLKTDPKARDVDTKVEALAGTPENKDEMFDLAAEVLEKIANEAKGDPEKMKILLLEAQQDPQKFYQSHFSEGQKKRVQGLAKDIERRKIASPPRN